MPVNHCQFLFYVYSILVSNLFEVLNLNVSNTAKLSYRSSTKFLRSPFTLIAYSVKFDLSRKELIFGGIINRGYLYWLISQIQFSHKSVRLVPPDNPNATGVTTSPDAEQFNLTTTAAITDSSTDSPVTSAATSEKTPATQRKL